MEVLYGNRFSKDLDDLRHEKKIRVDLLNLIEEIKAAESLAELKGVRKIAGYQEYYRIRLSDL